ncbi:hypothetical protein ACVWYH_002598 [Bradyrhizobium sp. GM24.11]
MVRRTNDSFLYRFKVEAINARYWLASAFEMAAIAPGIQSNVLAHRLSDCVGLDCLGGVSPGQASATDPSGRFAAIWPALCAGICALGLLAIWRAQGVQDVEPSVTTCLLMLVVAFNAGWFIGVMGEQSWH